MKKYRYKLGRNGYLKQFRFKRRDMVDAHKLARGCESPTCPWKGKFTPRMLEFDHINPKTKKFKLSDWARLQFSVKRFWAEVKKCRVLCANCHRIKTFDR